MGEIVRAKVMLWKTPFQLGSQWACPGFGGNFRAPDCFQCWSSSRGSSLMSVSWLDRWTESSKVPQPPASWGTTILSCSSQALLWTSWRKRRSPRVGLLCVPVTSL